MPKVRRPAKGGDRIEIQTHRDREKSFRVKGAKESLDEDNLGRNSRSLPSPEAVYKAADAK
jgi:hypothetical protein